MSAPQLGQAIGSIAGSAIAPGVGTTLGGLAGIMAGMVAQGQIDKATEKKEQKILSEQMDRPNQQNPAASEAMVIAAGEPTRVWIDETMQNGKVSPGHFEARHIQ